MEKEEQKISMNRQEILQKSFSQIIKSKLIPALKLHSKSDFSTDELNLDQINALSDGIEKYDKIVKFYERTKIQFTDTNFLASQRSLGLTTIPLVAGWKRPDPACKRFIAGYSPSDVLQGALGDCYFLSALSVLGVERTKNLFIFKEDEELIVGAILLKFKVNDEDVYVIIDTNFPVNTEGKWAFASSEQSDEL